MRLRSRSVPALVVVLLAGLVPAAATAQSGPEVVRRQGADRYATAAAVSEATFRPGTVEAWVATGEDFPDALAVGPLAGSVSPGPVLLVTRDEIPAATRNELRRLEPRNITVLGGPNAVSMDVVDDLRAFTSGAVRQFNEADRFATAARVAAEIAEDMVDVPILYVATGRGYADALAGGAAGAEDRAPMLLVERDTVPRATEAAIRDLEPGRVIVLGGPVAVSDQVVARLRALVPGGATRIAGQDRYDTAARVSAATFPDPVEVVHLATGLNYPDALAGTPAAARAGGPLLITRPDCLPDVVADEIDRLDPDRIVVLGGPGVVSSAAANGQRCASGGGPAALRTTTVTTDVDVPWDVVFTPDGRRFVTERDTGVVKEVLADGSTRVLTTFEVDNDGEGGLLGLTASPDFADDGWLYAYMTTPGDNRVLRFQVDDPSDFEVVISGIRAASTHDAGRIAFGPDGMLYIGTGDAQDRGGSQDLSKLHGKILRLMPDGAVPSDNPFGNAVWARGLRDPQGLAWDAAGRMYATEFGPDRDDEINRIVAGGNYGWPNDTGDNADPDHVDPIVVRQPPEASWSGMTALVGSAIPQWEGDLLVAALRGQRLYRIDLDDAGEVAGVEVVLDGRGRLRHAAQAPDGSVWVLTSNEDGRGTGTDEIIRIGP